MTLDEQLRHTLEALSERLRSDITAHLEHATKELIAVADAERARAAEQFAHEVRAEAEREISVRLRTTESDETIVSTKVGSARKVAAARNAVVPTRLGGHAAGVAAVPAEDSEADAQVLQNEPVDFQAGRPVLVSSPDGELDGERLLNAIRAIDRARSLSGVLDTLVAEVALQSPRTALFLANGAPLRSWRCSGFEAAGSQSTAIELPLEQSGIVGEAIRSGVAVVSTGPPSDAPSFAPAAREGGAIALPLSMAGQAVAVLYVDAGNGGPLTAARRTSLELITRYAARALEVITAFRAAQSLVDPSAHAMRSSPRSS